MRKTLSLLLAFLFATAVLAAPPAPAAAQKLHKLLDEEWEWQLRDNPEAATYIGDNRFSDRLTDRSAAAWAKRREHNRETLKRIEAIDRTKLSADDKLNYDLFLLQVRTAAEGDRFPNELPSINQMGGLHNVLGELAQQMPRDTVKDHENFLARMRAFPRAVDETIALLRQGAEQGITPARAVIAEVGGLIANQIVDEPEKSPIFELGFTNFRPNIPAAEQERLRTAAREVLRSDVLPAMRKLHAFWMNDYYPKTRQTLAWTDVPQGKEWYAWSVRRETTTDLTPDEIHTIGLSEVKRIRGEMEKVKAQAGFRGTLEEFFTFLRTDPRFYYTTREDLLVAYRDVSKRIDPELTRLFGRIPRLPYGVVPIPAYSEKTNTTAYYNAGSPESHRPGYYYVNLYDLKSRPKWEMEALSLHEAVPGHHFQIALAQELEGLPKFRQNGSFTAYVEGWGLYAESLGPELGMYTDPYSKFGQLSYEMWRAVRLVVDTGMHAKGWTRRQAIDYFVANSSKPLHDIEVEIDRYIVWPGQALAYKLGELKIKELRARAERELGDQFDVRAFHDTLLGAGPLPLSVLETRMNEWVAKQKGGRKATVTLRRE
ncbi:MAG TPA: DUF885 domain-containing protein [Thermoanaerobaculia bacterium]|nr:DUF885 domain-containing protein [Thermoanaerobaculia bacterium]